jgi:hypothetical protein
VGLGSVPFRPEALGLSRSRNRRVQLAALLHNIGLLFLPPEEASRTDEEEIDKKRIDLACQLLDGIQGMSFLVPAVRHHRERWDGAGYPDALKGEDIPLEARVTPDALKGEDIPLEARVCSARKSGATPFLLVLNPSLSVLTCGFHCIWPRVQSVLSPATRNSRVTLQFTRPGDSASHETNRPLLPRFGGSGPGHNSLWDIPQGIGHRFV